MYNILQANRAKMESTPTERIKGRRWLCSLFSSSSYLISSSPLLLFLFFQPHPSELCLIGGKVWTHLTVVLAEAETEATLASVSTGCEAAREMPLRVITTVVEIRLLAEVRLSTLVAGASVAAMFH